MNDTSFKEIEKLNRFIAVWFYVLKWRRYDKRYQFRLKYCLKVTPVISGVGGDCIVFLSLVTE